MELKNEFDVATAVDVVWAVFTDVERVATCLPGAQLLGSSGDTHEGLIKVKVGPIRMQYKGTMRFLEQDEEARRLVLHGEGRDGRGQGSAVADITIQLSGDDSAAHVVISTDLQITGKVAQFGRSVLADVSDGIVSQFARNLRDEISGTRVVADLPSVASSPTQGPASAGRPKEGSADAAFPTAAAARPSRAEDYVDLTGAGTAVLARAQPFLLIALAAGMIGWMLGRRR